MRSVRRDRTRTGRDRCALSFPVVTVQYSGLHQEGWSIDATSLAMGKPSSGSGRCSITSWNTATGWGRTVALNLAWSYPRHVGSALDPLEIPAELWQRSEIRRALESRDFGLLFRLVHKYVRGSQTQIGIAVGLTQATVSQVMAGRRQVTALDVIERIADGLAMPDTARLLLGLAPTAQPPRDIAENLSLPIVTLDDLSRIVAARNESLRPLDSAAIEQLHQQLL